MYDFEELDFYQLLGVSRSASPEEIKRAYRREIAKYHPDRFVQAPPAEMDYARRRSQMLTEAYATLSDFAARSSYNLDQRARERRSSQAARPTPPPPQPRDHQAELYDQARAHFDAGRYLQAAAVLRQLQQLNPFYRDSAELLAAIDERLRGRAAPPPAAPERKQSRLPLLFTGLTAIAALLIGGFWLLGGRNATPQAAEAGRLVAPATATPIPPTELPPTVTPIPPTELPPTVTPIPPTELPPTVTPQDTPSTVPTDTPTPAPQGALLLSDNLFDTGWAAARNTAWSVGPSGERYRITAAAQVGVIWSYRSVSANDVSVAADLEIIAGEGGLMLRFSNERNYLIYTVAPASGEYRLEQVSDGEPTLLVAGTNEAIRAGDGRGRIEAQLRGRQVSLAMNGVTLANVELPGASNAPRFGLVVVARDTRAEVFFDNLEIRALP